MAGVPANAGALVGKRLGHYELVALLALGGTAEIYLARIDGAAGFEKYVVVKCLHDHLAEDREFVQMFLDEARLGAQLDHSNIVQTLGLGEQDGRYYLVMEFIAGMSLAIMARRATERVPGGRIPVPLVLGIAAQACAGLHYAHDRESGGKPLNLVHRDISPQNLVITFEGDVRIVDFGIAKAEDRETATKSGTIKGKFAYMSPEQCHAKHIDRRTDVFALGVVVHELLTGRRLFKRGSTYETYQAILECKVPPPSSVNHELDPALDAVVMKALTKNPAQRYQTAEAFGEALTGYLHSRGKLAGATELGHFIQQYFAAEVDDHFARMRELLEGRAAAASPGWDEDDGGSASLRSEDAEELSQFEVIGEAAGGGAARLGPGPGSTDEDGDGDGDGDGEGAPVDATRIEMNPMALLGNLEAPRPAPPAPSPPPTRAPTVPAKPAARVPSFGSAGDASSMFGASSQAAGPVKPSQPSLPRLTGRPGDKTAPAGVPAIGAPAPGSHAAFGEGAGASTVLMDQPATTPGAPATAPVGPPGRAAPGRPAAARSFASAPEARTVMAPADPPPAARGLPASFEARLSEDTNPPPMGPGARSSMAYNATVPAMDAVAPELGGPPADAPTYRAPLADPLLGVQPMMTPSGVQAAVSSSGQHPMLTPSGLHPMMTPGALAPVSTPPPMGAAQPYPSGELLVAPYGTPPATSPVPDTSLPAHLIGLPPPTAYPRYDPSFTHPKLTRGLPGWVWPVGLGVIAIIAIGVVAAVTG